MIRKGKGKEKRRKKTEGYRGGGGEKGTPIVPIAVNLLGKEKEEGGRKKEKKKKGGVVISFRSCC